MYNLDAMVRMAKNKEWFIRDEEVEKLLEKAKLSLSFKHSGPNGDDSNTSLYESDFLSLSIDLSECPVPEALWKEHGITNWGASHMNASFRGMSYNCGGLVLVQPNGSAKIIDFVMRNVASAGGYNILQATLYRVKAVPFINAGWTEVFTVESNRDRADFITYLARAIPMDELLYHHNKGTELPVLTDKENAKLIGASKAVLKKNKLSGVA